MKNIKRTLLLIIFVLTFSFTPKCATAQDDVDAEEFLGIMSVTLSEEQLDELSYLLPWDIRVFSYAYGDFSDDGKTDIVVALRETGVTADHTLDVYYFENVGDKTYKLIKKVNVTWVELPVEVAFLAKDGVCMATSRDKSNWYFTAYKIDRDNLVQVNKEVFPIGIEKAGDNGDN